MMSPTTPTMVNQVLLESRPPSRMWAGRPPGGLSYQKKAGPPVWGAGWHARNDWPSEVDLGSQLHAARGSVGADLAERADGDVRAGVSVGLHQVERVESFQTNLQLRLPLAQDVETLHQAGVQVREAGSAHPAADGIAGTVGVLRHSRKAGRVEIQISRRRDAGEGVRRVGVRIANHVGPRAGGAGAQQAEAAGVQAGSGHRERRTAIERGQAGNLPAAECQAENAPVVLEEGQRVDVIQRQYLLAVAGVRAVFACVPVVAVLRSVGAVAAVIGEVLGPGVGHVELARAPECLAELRLQRTVVGIERGQQRVDGVEAKIRTDGVDVIGRKSTRLKSSHLGISYAVFC